MQNVLPPNALAIPAIM